MKCHFRVVLPLLTWDRMFFFFLGGGGWISLVNSGPFGIRFLLMRSVLRIHVLCRSILKS